MLQAGGRSGHVPLAIVRCDERGRGARPRRASPSRRRAARGRQQHGLQATLSNDQVIQNETIQ